MADLFHDYGIHCVVDGQFGSTGKGALAAWLAEQSINGEGGLKPATKNWGGTISNAGPNSGHTFYHRGEKHVLKQLPTFSVYFALEGLYVPAYLGPGAIIDPGILAAEAKRYPDLLIYVHPNAAVITPQDKEAEHHGSVAAVAGTRSGTGRAIANKVLRDGGSVFSWLWDNYQFPANVHMIDHDDWHTMLRDIVERPYFMEVSQGFSLGINQRFFPKCTSRECTVAQGIADAGLSPASVTRTYMAVRTFPIRVGNVDGFSSGGYYPDQEETTWEDLHVDPELTTVTKRVRRVFTWSDQQFTEALTVNTPDFVFVNFMNYLTDSDQRDMVERINRHRKSSAYDFEPIWGHGPTVEDVKW
jgi:adenylosuccinate synthase